MVNLSRIKDNLIRSTLIKELEKNFLYNYLEMKIIKTEVNSLSQNTF